MRDGDVVEFRPRMSIGPPANAWKFARISGACPACGAGRRAGPVPAKGMVIHPYRIRVVGGSPIQLTPAINPSHQRPGTCVRRVLDVRSKARLTVYYTTTGGPSCPLFTMTASLMQETI